MTKPAYHFESLASAKIATNINPKKIDSGVVRYDSVFEIIEAGVFAPAEIPLMAANTIRINNPSNASFLLPFSFMPQLNTL